MRRGRAIGGLALLALAGSGFAQTPALLTPPPGSVCPAPTVSTEPGNVHMFPGRWWNPQRNGIGWDFFYGEGQESMYLTWFTYDANGRPVWLHGENKRLEFNAVTGERTWQSNLYVAHWTFSALGRTFTPVGSVSVTFPNQTTTRAAVRWRWDQGSSIAPVGGSTYEECLYDTFRDQRRLRNTEGVINQAFSSNWFYRGIEGDPLVGWGVDLLIDIDPDDEHYIETAAAAIFDTSGRPVWLQSEDDWGASAPPDDTTNATTRGALRYIRYTPVVGVHPAVTVCENATAICGAYADHDGTAGPDTYGRFGRRVEDAANGRMLLTAEVAASVTGGAAVDWPPPNNVPSLPEDVPVMRFDANHVIVDKTVCRVPGPNDTCTFQVSWSTNDANAQIRRLDLNNGGASSPFATGLSNVLPDPLPVGARVQYEITYRYNGTGVLTTLRTPEVRVLRQDAIADASVQNIACTPQGNNGCDLPIHDARTGAIAGEASTEGGAAQYAMPITVPPGRNGMEPTLSLTYSSRGGNGVAGLGWSLSGLSAIHRCPKTTAQDGAGNAAAVSLGNGDALCLDGQRLVATDATGNAGAANLVYGALGTYYRTELDTFARVRQYGGDLASGASCFKMEHKSGAISYYGGVHESTLLAEACSGGGSRQVPDGVAAPLSWNIEREQDAPGNSMVYVYSVANQYGKGEKLLEYIRYTGKDGVGGDRYVYFDYDDRPTADRSRSYLAAGLTERTQRLTRIATAVAGTSVNSYTLNYADPISGLPGNLHSGRSALQSIRQCATGGEETQGPGANGNEVCLPETVVSWNDLPPDYVLRPVTVAGLPEPAANANGGFVDRQVQTIGDLDGDGVREVLVYQGQADQQMHIWLVKQNADRAVTSTLEITSIAGSMLYFTQGMQTDYDGDGRADLVAADEGAYLRLYRWSLARGANFGGTPAATFTTVTLTGVAPGHQLVSSDDLNGDGQSDLLLRRRGSSCSGLQIEETIPNPNGPTSYGHILCYYPNTTTSTTAVSFGTGVQVYGWSHDTQEGGLSSVGDLNGDGTADLTITTETTQPGGTVNAITTVLLSRIPGTTPPSGCTATSTPAQWYACTPTAMNLPTTDTGYRTTGASMRWHDVNGDGLVDLLYAVPGTCSNMGHSCTRGSWHVQIANGRGLNASVGIGGNTDALLMTTGMEKNRLRYAGLLPSADLDSDGKADLLYPVALAARQCTAVNVSYQALPGELCDYEWNSQNGGGAESTEMCEATVWMCGNDPAADIGAATAQYELPVLGDMPALPFTAAITTDDIYSVRTHRANFAAADQSLYYMAGLRFVATANGYEAQSFSLDASAGVNRNAHRVAMTLNDTTSLNNAEDLYGDGLADLMTRVGCYNAGINASYCHFVGNGSDGPESVAIGPTPNAAPSSLDAIELNDGLRSFVNENVGAGENGYAAPVLPGLVRLINTGLYDKTSWNYFPLSGSAFRTAGQLPLYTIPPAGYVDSSHFYFQSTMPVVGSMTSSTGNGGLLGFRTWRYGYSEAMYNRLGRGFQGFRAIVREQAPLSGDQPRAVRELTLFHQKYPLTGKIELTRSGAPLPTIANEALVDWVRPFTEVSYAWGCRRADRGNCPTAGAPAVTSFDYPFLNQQLTTQYDVALAEAGTRSKVADVAVNHYDPNAKGAVAGWDAYGNLTHTFTVARDLAETPGSILFVTSRQTARVSSYINTINSSTWWPGRLAATDDTIAAVQYGAAHPLPADANTPAQTLHTDYDWNPDRTPATVTVENADPNLRTHKVFTYPAGGSNYGLPSAVSDTYYDSVVGGNVTRTTQTLYTGGDGYFPTSTIDASGAETKLSYRARDGQVRETTLPTQVRARTAYDAFGRGIRTDTFTVSGSTETPLGQSVHTAWNLCAGASCPGADIGSGGVRIDNPGSPAETYAAYRITTVQNGSPTRVVWHDLLHREIKSVVRGFDGTFVATLSEYDRMGALAKKSVPFFLTSGSSAAPFASSFSYDRAGRVTSKTDPDGEIAIGQTPPAGRQVSTTYTYAGNRTMVQVRNSRGLCTPANACVDVVRYSGVLGLMRTDDALNGVTRYWADAANRPVAIADAKTNAQYPGSIPAGKVTRASYNKLGHRTNAADPNQGNWNFVYNGAGELVQQTDARAIGTTIQRDPAGRPMVQKTWIPAWEGSPAEHYRDEWTYRPGDGLVDDVKRCIASALPASCTLNQAPNLTGNTVWRESYVYDHGRVASVTAMQRVGTSELTYPTLYHYDGNYGREKAVEYASGLKVQRIFTKFGVLRDVLDADTGERFWGIGGQDAFGNVTRQDYGNGVYGEYGYDVLSGRAVRKQWSRLVNGVPQVLDSVDYGYDVLANVAAQRRVVPGVVNATESYTYDKLQRLKSSSVSESGYSVGYDYDALGNLTRKNDYSRDVADAYAYASANGCGPNVATRILMPASAGYDRVNNTCDANGNVTLTQPATDVDAPQGSPRKIRYDATNRPRNIMDQGAPSAPSAMFTYAPDGRRVYEVLSERYFPNPGDTGVNRLRFIVQGQRGYQVELMSDANGWSNATYRHEIGDVSVVLRAVPGNAGLTRDVAYKILDRAGSPLGVMDKDGKFRQRSENGYINNADTRLTFSPFGAGRRSDFQPRDPTGEMPGRINLTPATRQGFTGHEHLDSLGLIHMNGRVYDHRLGRFLSVDPFIQFPANSQSLNPYSYILNNPMAGKDPSGYRARGIRKPFVDIGPCMGKVECEYQQTFSGPVSDFRNSVMAGGAPKSAWNGHAVRPAKALTPSVEIGALTTGPASEVGGSETVYLAPDEELAINSDATRMGSLHVTDRAGRALGRELTDDEKADVAAANMAIGMLREAVEASGDEAAKAALSDTHFRYVPVLLGKELGDGKVGGHIKIDRPGFKSNVISFFRGMALYVTPEADMTQSYNMMWERRGPTLGMYIAAHELGHAVQGETYGAGRLRENKASNYALSLIRNHPHFDSGAISCLKECD